MSELSELEGYLVKTLKEVFQEDKKHINHTVKVKNYSKIMMGRLDSSTSVNSSVILAAAILHDIGIPKAEKKYGSSAPEYQQTEGPPLARQILTGTGLSSEEIDHICRIIANHHDPKDIDTLEFKLVYDADLLANKQEGNRKEDDFLTKLGTELASDFSH